MLKNKKKIAFIFIIVMLLIAVRTFEVTLFYDPFLSYFKSEFFKFPLPTTNPIKLFLSLGFRFYINSMLSLALLYVIFKDTKMIRFAGFLYVVLGSVLLISFFFVLHFFGEENKMILFYIRRFIIQPIFIMLFIPAFYYQKKVK